MIIKSPTISGEGPAKKGNRVSSEWEGEDETSVSKLLC